MIKAVRHPSRYWVYTILAWIGMMYSIFSVEYFFALELLRPVLLWLVIREEVEGLIHISEISDEHIGHPKEVLHDGEKVTLRIIKIEPESHRIGLSLRRVESAAYADLDMKLLKQE